MRLKIYFIFHSYAFSLENDEKYRARRLGVLRREYQVRNHTMFNHRNQEDLLAAYEKLPILANELINVLILRTPKNAGLSEIKPLLAAENEFSSFRAAC